MKYKVLKFIGIVVIFIIVVIVASVIITNKEQDKDISKGNIIEKIENSRGNTLNDKEEQVKNDFNVFEITFENIANHRGGFGYTNRKLNESIKNVGFQGFPLQAVSDINTNISDEYRVTNNVGIICWSNKLDPWGNMYAVDVYRSIYNRSNISKAKDGELRVISGGPDGNINTSVDNFILTTYYKAGELQSKVYGFGDVDNVDITNVVTDATNVGIISSIDNTDDYIGKSTITNEEANELGIVFNSNLNTIIEYKGNAKNLIIPSVIGKTKVLNIGYKAFSNTSLENVSISYGVKRISAYAFYSIPFDNEGLISVEIPDTISYIGSGAFSGNRLKNVKIPKGIDEINSCVFSENEIESIDIPSNIRYINSCAFRNNNIKEKVINEGIKGISEDAFSISKCTDVNGQK